ncbi:hypothetical protein CDD83_10191 [Cordyceps sp. RAO-2017]|nr:hypothetical protein CDD83_10191 [Cordyceps sp. RAO-2017]
MGKRASSCLNGVAVFRKRQKVAHDVPNGEDVQSSDHLRQLLAFDQNLRKVRHGLQSFKSLLDDIMSDKVDRIGKVDILRQYLGAVEPRDTGHDAVFLSDIMDACL